MIPARQTPCFNTAPGAAALHHRAPFIVPAPFIYFNDLFEKLIDSFYNLAEAARKRIILPDRPPGAIKYGTRTKKITSIFDVKIEVRIQRFRTADGRTCSPDFMTLPQGCYDINLVHFGVVLYSSGVPAEMVRNIINAYFGLNVSTGTVLNWVRVVSELGYREHRMFLDMAHERNRYAPQQLGMDELYFTISLDEVPRGITLVVDLERSLILDVYVFDGRTISSVDVQRIYSDNSKYLTKVDVVTADGAKAYNYFAELVGNAIRVVCVQHKTRNIKKRGIVKKLMGGAIEAERSYLESTLNKYFAEKEEKFGRSLEYVLPKVLPKGIRELLYRDGWSIFSDIKAKRQKEYMEAIEEHLKVYKAYVHHRVYVAQQAAVTGALMRLYKDKCESGDNVDYCGALQRALNVVNTTAMIEGMNRPLRNRLRRAVHIHDRRLIEAISKLFLLQHNTLSRIGGTTAYEKIGVPLSEMRMNPFLRLYLHGGSTRHESGDVSKFDTAYRVREELYGSMYGKMMELRYPLAGLKDDNMERTALEPLLKARNAALSVIL